MDGTRYEIVSALSLRARAAGHAASTVCRGLGAALLRARAEAGLTQQELGALAGVSGGMVSKYETGANQPPLEVLVAMAVGLGIRLDQLTGLAEPDAPAAESGNAPAAEPVDGTAALAAVLAPLPAEVREALAGILGGLLRGLFAARTAPRSASDVAARPAPMTAGVFSRKEM